MTNAAVRAVGAIGIFLCLWSSVSAQEEPLYHHINCTNKADIILILDSSGSIGWDNWDRLLNFCSNVAHKFEIGPNNTLFGSVYYSSTAHKHFDLEDYADATALVQALQRTPYLRMGTQTVLALDLVIDDMMFSSANGGRDDANKFAVVITDGKSHHGEATVEAATRLKQLGVTVITVGVGDQCGLPELKAMASSENHVLTIDSYQNITNIFVDLVINLCTEQVCNGSADIIFAIDSSEHTGTYGFSIELPLSAETTGQLPLGVELARFGAVVFGDSAQKLFDLGDYDSYDPMAAALLSAPYLGGDTNLDEALRFIKNQHMFSPSAGGRDDPCFEKIVVILTRGGFYDYCETSTLADELKESGIIIMAVGVGDDVDLQELTLISSSPEDVFLAAQKNAFFERLKALATRCYCSGQGS